MVLTDKTLLHLNNAMLGRGAPIERDGVGYNKPDFANMKNIPGTIQQGQTLDNWTRRDIAETLLHYTKTQLENFADDLKETAKYYRQEAEKNKMQQPCNGMIFVAGHDKSGLILEGWRYNAAMRDYIARDHKTNYRWFKSGDNFLLHANWNGLEALSKAFEKNGFNPENINNAFKAIDFEKLEEEEAEKKNEATKVRFTSALNGLYLQFSRNESVSDFINGHRDIYKWSKAEDGSWRIYTSLNNAEPLLNAMRAVGFNTEDVDREIGLLKEDPMIRIRQETCPIIFFGIKEKLGQKEEDKHIGCIGIYTKSEYLNKEVFSKMPSAARLPSGTGYAISYFEIPALYDKIMEVGAKYDMSDFRPYLDMTQDWDIEYEQIEPPCEPFKPYDFQLKDVDEMLQKHTMIQGSEMGCGKTTISVRTGLAIPHSKLVVCPASLRTNWEREIKMLDPNADVSIIQNKDKEVEEHEWMIIGYPSMAKHAEALKKINPQAVFVDEAHYIKAVDNYGRPASQRGKAVLEVAAKAGWVYAITGTPKTSRNKDLFNLLKMTRNPVVNGVSFFDFGMKFCDGQDNGFGYDFNGNSNDKELNEALKPYMIRHLKKDVLPHLTKQRQQISLDSSVTKYNQYMKKAKEALAKKPNDPCVLGYMVKARQALALSKIDDTLDFADTMISSGEPVVIVTNFTGVIEKAEKHFGSSCCKVVGGMEDKEKQQAIDDFQNGKKDAILLNIDAGGVGITLTKSHIMLINDLPWTTGQVVQVEDRICRTGQDKECMIYYMTAQKASIERKMVETLTQKSFTINQAIDDGKGEEIDFRTLMKADLSQKENEVPQDKRKDLDLSFSER